MKTSAASLARILPALIVVGFTVFLEAQKMAVDKELLKQLENIATTLPYNQLSPSNQAGTVTFLKDNSQLTEAQMHDELRARSNVHHSYGWGEHNTWGEFGRTKPGFSNYSSTGTDFKHHFANSFLVGIHPFKVDNPALPLYSLAQRKMYQRDEEQYGKIEVWQNSAEAFVNLRGDCEDHAMVLADWLISEGIDAKVVVGKVPEGGHAWVVATIAHQEYLLEATSKRVNKSWNHYPLASLSTNYLPKFMFNRTQFWVNTGSQYTTDYSGGHWLKTSTFEKH